MSGPSHRHRGSSLEEASPQPIQLVESTQGLDEFAPEPEVSLLRVEPPGAPTSPPMAVPVRTVSDVRRSHPIRTHPVRFDWAPYARRAALASSLVIAATAGILVLQPSAPPQSPVDPIDRMNDSARRPTVADSPPVSPAAAWTAPSASPSV